MCTDYIDVIMVKKHLTDIIIKYNHIVPIEAIEKDFEKINLVDDLGFDSICLIKAVIDIEKTFCFEFDDEQLDFHEIIIVENLIKYISYKIGEKNE